MALQVGRIEDVHDEVRLLVQQEVAGDYLVDGIRSQAVDARQVDEAVLPPVTPPRSFPLLHSDAGIVADLVVSPRERVEKRGLP